MSSKQDPSRQALKLFAQAHIERKKLVEETKAKRGIINQELVQARKSLLEILNSSPDQALGWATDTSSGIVKIKTNNSKRKLNESHVRDVIEDVEPDEIQQVFAHSDDLATAITMLAEKLTKSIMQARTVTSTNAEVRVGSIKRKPKNLSVASNDVISLGLKVNNLTNSLSEMNKNYKEHLSMLDSKIEENSTVIESMLKSQNTNTQKINVRDENDEANTYFIRLKPSKTRAATSSRGLSSDKLHEMMSKALLEIFEALDGNQESTAYEEAFISNRERLIETMLANCTECQGEENLSGGGQDEYKLSFDKSTGTRKRSLDSMSLENS